ncbi:hypothetical protein GTY87_32570 [Streptomyces sp. SID7813]|uniref:Very hypotheticl protein SC4A2.08 n=1 Tax=Streptomyces coelicolor (strain ATCC BAA-471 / A3(2) / M145) TaxID=100226 RepID=O86664_STRCO|nr:hypothetical protein [Streptomyces sp. SID7813]QFI46181.1 hypothetical protein FQ762_32900 [Streptomyces coelicolor A3(2)]CAA20160.1 very hypotheticl protein SC4A2.08 [Streptomyces coelicolor A3(2)]
MAADHPETTGHARRVARLIASTTRRDPDLPPLCVSNEFRESSHELGFVAAFILTNTRLLRQRWSRREDGEDTAMSGG